MMSPEKREISLLGSALIPKSSHTKGFPDNTIVSSRYTLITFLPKNLYEQFHRMVNFFFLCLLVIQLVIDIPVNPISYAAAFIFVISVTAVKQGYEDWCRHRSDNKVNFAKVQVLIGNKGGQFQGTNSKDIRVGQVVRLGQDDAVPCDLLLLACAARNGKINQSYCQITTANLDGESTLKIRTSLPQLSSLFKIVKDTLQCSDALHSSSLKLIYDLPKSDLYKFSGELVSATFDRPVPVTMDNVLLRGSRLKHCHFAVGIAIYTGKDTRLSMNSGLNKRQKFTTVDHAMNKIVIGMMILLLVLSFVSVGLCFMYKKDLDKAWYLPHMNDSDFKTGRTTFFTYLVLLCYLIPVSLPVTVELQKLMCSKYFAWDRDMICPKTHSKPLCNTSDLNEELGQVEYLFTDKTGTLTENDLVFKACCINNVRYRYFAEERCLAPWDVNLEQDGPIKLENVLAKDKNIQQFFTALALCHSIRVVPPSLDQTDPELSTVKPEVEYQGESLDELVLIDASSRLGIKFSSEEDDFMSLELLGEEVRYKRFAVLEFDSDRKCMSIIVKQDKDNQYLLYTKGAESSLLSKCSNPEDVVSMEKNVTALAKQGLRTLVVGYRILQPTEVEEFIAKSQQLKNDSTELNKLYGEMESNLIVLGCTGVEDKLQMGVPETLRALKDAGIKITMLTGDKLETALSIGISSGLIPSSKNSQDNDQTSALFSSDSCCAIITSIQDSDTLFRELLASQSLIKTEVKSVLVMDGLTLGCALDNPACKKILSEIFILTESVLICRMAPIQKAQVVKMVKNTSKKPLTCAVGDGGNDCPMLHEANIGIGIIGKEGLQASREADFAVAQFRFLQKAILVHGHWYYQRLATLIKLFFYRGIFFIFQIFLYGFDSGFSGRTIFDSTFVMMFTISFTSLPVLVQGLVEQLISQEELLSNPCYYKELSRNNLMSFRKTLRFGLVTLWDILICYYVPRTVWVETGVVQDYGAYSLFISSVIVLIADTKILIESRYLTWWALGAQAWSYLSMLGFYYLICEVGSGSQGALRFSYFILLQQSEFWFIIFLVGLLSVVPDLFIIALSKLKLRCTK